MQILRSSSGTLKRACAEFRMLGKVLQWTARFVGISMVTLICRSVLAALTGRTLGCDDSTLRAPSARAAVLRRVLLWYLDTAAIPTWHGEIQPSNQMHPDRILITSGHSPQPQLLSTSRACD